MADSSGLADLRITFHPRESGEADPVVRDVSARYAAMLDKLVRKVGLSPDAVVNAEVVVSFAQVVPEPEEPARSAWAPPLNCEVLLLDSRGREHRARCTTRCRAHDPLIELRSTRA
ncbi:MAG: hypothetical protein AAF488_01555 [Planctomycetota bacterium]